MLYFGSNTGFLTLDPGDARTGLEHGRRLTFRPYPLPAIRCRSGRNWDEGIHGFNFQAQLYRCTPGNCLWVVPGTHKLGKVDIRKLVAENGGSDRLPQAVPLFCEAGGVTVVNRQALHGSFANTSPDLRVSYTFGFHRRTSVEGQRGALVVGRDQVYDDARIFQRSSVIALAIDARAQRFPDEARFVYQPFIGLEDEHRWNDDARARLHNYSLLDLGI